MTFPAASVAYSMTRPLVFRTRRTRSPAASVVSAGRTVHRVVGEGGSILEQTLNTAGNVVNARTVGNLLDLQLLGQTTNAAGQTVRRVTDTTGAILEYTLDAAGQPTNIRLLQGATGGR